MPLRDDRRSASQPSDAGTSDRTLSDAPTSESGISAEGGIKPYQSSPQSTTRQSPGGRGSTLPPAVPATCTMCDAAMSEYMCVQCGRLSFCLKCCVSLHDNKFLGGHKLVPVDAPADLPEDKKLTVADLKRLMNSRDNASKPQRVAPPPVPTLDIDVPADPKEVRNRNNRGYQDPNSKPPGYGIDDAGEPLDMAAINADRRLLKARIAEVGRCAEVLRNTATKAAHEKAQSAEATRTAADAVTRRFDIVRQLLNAKEKEYIEVVERAGKRRLDAATQAATGVTIAASEAEAYRTHMTTQLDRLEGNNRQFNDCRRQLLDDVADRTRRLDDSVMHFERALEDVQSITLGVTVHLNLVINAVQALDPPPAPTTLGIGVHYEPIKADAFYAEPGVQQWDAKGQLVSRGVPGQSAERDRAGSVRAPTPRKSLAQHVEDLRNSPMPTSRQNHQEEGQAVPSASPSRTGAAGGSGGGALPSSTKAQALVARAAARYQQHTAATTGGVGGDEAARPKFPSQLATLKKHMAQRQAASGSGGSAQRRSVAETILANHPTPVTSRSAAEQSYGRSGSQQQQQHDRPARTARTPRSTVQVPQVANSAPAAATGGRAVGSPAGRARSPLARVPPTANANTPSSRIMSPTAAMRIRMSMGADTPAVAPGPGSYFAHGAGRNRTTLINTPPRRALSPALR